MHEFVAKIARAAASKMAAFGYAVAVGVAGNLAFHFVQPHDPAPAALASPAPNSASVAAPPAADTAPAVMPPALVQPPPATPAPAQSVSSKPVSIKPVATAPILPATPTIDLPNTAALPAPALRPTALPISHAPAHPIDTAALPEAAGPLTPVTPHVSFAPPPATTPPPTTPLTLTPASPYGAAPSRTTASIPLDPIGRPIDVAPVPNPPAAALSTAPPPTALLLPKPATPPTPEVAPPAAKAEPGKTDADHSLELSDLWHPSRAVRKSLNWADQQLPSLGGSDTAAAVHPAAHAPSVAAPISLLPSSADGGLQGGDNAEPAKPVKPGPGSGGLY